VDIVLRPYERWHLGVTFEFSETVSGFTELT
jgi:hypothetical protein